MINTILSRIIQIYFWWKNKKETKKNKIDEQLNEIWKKYDNFGLSYEEFFKNDDKAREYTNKFSTHYQNYLNEIILKMSYFKLNQDLICKTCSKSYLFKDWREFLENWKFKNSFELSNFDLNFLMKTLNKSSITISKVPINWDTELKISYDRKLNQLSNLKCPLCWKQIIGMKEDIMDTRNIID